VDAIAGSIGDPIDSCRGALLYIYIHSLGVTTSDAEIDPMDSAWRSRDFGKHLGARAQLEQADQG
jgi:hypothetical protein